MPYELNPLLKTYFEFSGAQEHIQNLLHDEEPFLNKKRIEKFHNRAQITNFFLRYTYLIHCNPILTHNYCIERRPEHD